MLRSIFTSSGVAVAALGALSFLYIYAEPALTYGAVSTTTEQFTISQAVTSEIAFKTPPSNIVMSPSLNGATGGTATGQTQFVVETNNYSGYTMTVSSDSSLGMIGLRDPASYIAAYVPGGAGPDYTFAVNSPRGTAFGYTVAASTTADIAVAFRNNGSACGSGTGNTGAGASHCWLNASTTPVTIVNRASPTAASGSTSTLMFQTTIAPSPSPALPNDTYIATTTVTVSANP